MKRLQMRNSIKIAGALALVAVVTSGCATSYQIHSTPEGASVQYTDPVTQKKLFLGTTPLSYSKSGLPTDKAFVLTVLKDGFGATDVPMAATDESKTIVNVRLKPDDKSSSSKQFNEMLKKFFSAQKLIYDRQFHAAILELDKLIGEHPDVSQSYVMKGTCYYLLNEMQSATQAWEAALKLDPENPELLRFLDDNKIAIKQARAVR